ncbi:MAG: 3-hydroxyacyl-CoA dehydrogenase NAD-binding domain-containing protein [Pirellulaceae bacterium]
MNKLLIVGAGWVGRQIAAQAMHHGIATVLLDKSATILNDAEEWIQRHLRSFTSDPKSHPSPKAFGQLKMVERLEQLPDDLTVALESVPEQISVKRRCLTELSERLPQDVVLASNSSYFTPSMLAKYVRHPERFLHWHFHVPVWITRLVDVVPCSETNPDAIERIRQLSLIMGQEPVYEPVEHPGYLFNWMLQALLKAALELSSKGVANPQTIDHVWRTVAQMPLGPFQIMDQIGVDTIHQVISNARWADASLPLQDLIDGLEPLLADGRLGVKSGQGFYDYPQSAKPR